MSLLSVRGAIADTLRNALGEAVKTVEPLPGRLDLDEIKRRSARLPGVFVACLGVGTLTTEGGLVVLPARWGAFVLAKDALPDARRDAVVLGLAQAVLARVVGERWGRPDVRRAAQVAGENVYSASLDTQGVALWAVTWSQSVQVDPSEAEQLADLKRIGVAYDLAPTDGRYEAQDLITLGERP